MNNSSDSFETIKHSLQNYEEEYIPGSWEGFLQQRRSSRRKLFLRIASGIAASLLLFLTGTTYYISNRNAVPEVATTQVPVPPGVTPPAGQSSEPKTVIVPESRLTASADQKRDASEARPGAVAARNMTAATREMPDFRPDVPASVQGTTPEISAAVAVGTDPKIQETQDTAGSKRDTTRVQTMDLFRGTPSTAGNTELAETYRRKVRFGVNFSPGISTAQSSGSFNYTGGLSADIPLSSRFELTTGLQVENQSIVKNIPGIVSSSNTPENEEKTKVTNLDVPLNVTWKFFSEKSRTYYISAGLSSLVYLWQQDRNTTYSQDLVPVASLVSGQEILSYKVVNQVSVEQYSGTPDQAFDFAGRVNILVGFETKLSGRLYMHIEPYAKIPTSGQAPANLNHTSTGVNFKISF